MRIDVSETAGTAIEVLHGFCTKYGDLMEGRLRCVKDGRL